MDREKVRTSLMSWEKEDLVEFMTNSLEIQEIDRHLRKLERKTADLRKSEKKVVKCYDKWLVVVTVILACLIIFMLVYAYYYPYGLSWSRW